MANVRVNKMFSIRGSLVVGPSLFTEYLQMFIDDQTFLNKKD